MKILCTLEEFETLVRQCESEGECYKCILNLFCEEVMEKCEEKSFLSKATEIVKEIE